MITMYTSYVHVVYLKPIYASLSTTVILRPRGVAWKVYINPCSAGIVFRRQNLTHNI